MNARPAHAKDVQLLFADSATGARSSGIVSQGRIGAIIGARPVDRRALLEEAANIRGLHARRHEAELRLRAAETNLERLDDVIAGLVEQRDSLRKQARQASRYRSVADRIRRPRPSFCWQDGQRPDHRLPKATMPFAPHARSPRNAPRPQQPVPPHVPKRLPPCRNCGKQRSPAPRNFSALPSVVTSSTAKRRGSAMPSSA